MNSLKIIVIFVLYAVTSPSQTQEIKPSSVKKTMELVAEWQIVHFTDLYSGHKEPHHPLDRTNGL